MPPLTQYDLGKLGVNVDSSPIHKLDGELSRAQNAIRNTKGVDGGITNRGGYSNLNGTATGGSVLGGIGVPLGDGPGSGSDIRRIYIPSINTGASFAGWIYSDDDFTTAQVDSKIAAPGFPGTGFYFAAVANNKLFYLKNNGFATATQVVRSYNGRTDYEASTLLPSGLLVGPTAFAVLDGQLYLTTLDSGTSDADWVGRVFRMDTETGHLTQIGPAFPTGYIPTTLALYQNDLYVGGTRATNTNLARIYKIRPDVENSWTNDETMSTGIYAINHLYRWGAYLYVATSATDAGNASVLRRSIDGSYTAVLTPGNVGVATGQFGLNFAEFGGYLYVSWYDGNISDAFYRSSTGAAASWSALTEPVGGLTYFVASPTALFSLGVSDNNIYKSTNGTSFGAAINLSTLTGQTIASLYVALRLDVVNL